MVLLRFRAWYVLAEEMINEILMISFVRKEIIGKFSDGSTSVPLKFEDKRNGEDVVLMQSTGLKDKNGKEIFEGDVLQIDFIKAIVRFGQYRYYDNAGKDVLTGNGFYLECLNVMDPDCISPYETDILYKAEIIGNIYENPEYDQNFVGFRIKGE